MKIYNYNNQANICGENIKRLRLERKMSQTDLAAKLQTYNVILEQKSISRIESGDRVVADYELLAFSKIFKVDILSLLDDK